ncbi:MAG: PQQ-dependent sugar dehydrogenase [Synechococcales cyanobacterium M58_A2018_015]|nr:PQQ-dependent sugar dehydrogenase [Synechococcales cyanobacterium M58_A2018_015]
MTSNAFSADSLSRSRAVTQAPLRSSSTLRRQRLARLASSSGNGLRGQYFDNANFTNLKLTRTDAGVNFNWRGGSPDPRLGSDTFSVRWTGKVQPRYSELYTFSVRANDGVRLWVNGKKIIDQWRSRPTAATHQGKILLEADKQYDIRLDYYENDGNALARLFWSSPQQAREIIPGSRLFTSGTTPGGLPTATAVAANVTGSGGSSYDFTVTYRDDTGVDVSSLDNNDIRVTGPNGFNQLAQFVSVDTATNGTPRTATYRIAAPGGSWDAADNGSYTLTLQANQVSDISGNRNRTLSLGSFQADIRDAAPIPDISLSRYAGGLTQPVDIVNAKDGSNRLFVLEQAGRVRVVQSGVVQSSPFLDISSRVKSGGEEGLLSLAFSPNYASTRRLYAYYTNQNGDIVLSRFQANASGTAADPSSETVLLTIPHPTYTNHNGGKLAFGPDGYLYVSVGDGGGGGDPDNNAQNPGSLLGKVLRLDVESPGVATYAIPATNPFLAATDPSDRYRDEIWALGLRNPWRLSFDRQTGDLYIADVGQSAREEVNFQPAASRGGENYGWKILEGTIPYAGGSTSGLTPPLLEYDHVQGGRSITGGYVYRGNEFQSLQGIYFYGDFINGKLWGARRSAGGTVENKLVNDTPYGISTFGEDEQGNLYVADYFKGDIYKLGI